jgi:hypothetical protein
MYAKCILCLQHDKTCLKKSINAFEYVCISQIVAHECGNGYFVQFENIKFFEKKIDFLKKIKFHQN